MNYTYGNQYFSRDVFDETEVVKRPTYGIVSGYHQLPYILLGKSETNPSGTVEIRGKVNVSPRFVISPGQLGPTYGEVFGEDLMDSSLVGRVFTFLYSRKRSVKVESEYLTVKEVSRPLEAVLAEVLDELERKEIINTGVIICPNVKFYPVSVERFISSVLDQEFLP